MSVYDSIPYHFHAELFTPDSLEEGGFFSHECLLTVSRLPSFFQAADGPEQGEPEALGEGVPQPPGQGQRGVHARRVQADRPLQKRESSAAQK